MKAIAKYLPVNSIDLGIKPPRHPNMKTGNIMFGGVVMYDEKGKPTRVKPHKLFAVTQDIKEGDDLQTAEGIKVTVDETKTAKTFYGTDGSKYNLEVFFKVLGGLSPDATWEIKDGDEIEVKKRFPVFEHDEGGEWELITGWHPGDYEKSTPPKKMTVEKKAKDKYAKRTGIKKSVPVRVRWIVKVLGPCGHYH